MSRKHLEPLQFTKPTRSLHEQCIRNNSMCILQFNTDKRISFTQTYAKSQTIQDFELCSEWAYNEYLNFGLSECAVLPITATIMTNRETYVNTSFEMSCILEGSLTWWKKGHITFQSSLYNFQVLLRAPNNLLQQGPLLPHHFKTTVDEPMTFRNTRCCSQSEEYVCSLCI